MTQPVSHLQAAQQLTADAIVDLFEIKLRDNTVFRLKNSDSVTWQGRLYNGLPCKLSGDTRSADEEESRPSFTLANPEGVFTKAVFEGRVERATLTRYKILRAHLDANLNVFLLHRWWVSRVSDLVSGEAINLELRSLSEGPNFQIPCRVYQPPEFPVVRL